MHWTIGHADELGRTANKLSNEELLTLKRF
jgi:hypothetical protein